MPVGLDLNTSKCIVERDFVYVGYDDYFDICHGVHHFVAWTYADWIGGFFILGTFMAVAALGFLAVKIVTDPRY